MALAPAVRADSRPTLPALSPQLSRWLIEPGIDLVDAREVSDARREIAANPALARELKAAAAAIEAAVAPAGIDGVIAVLTPLMAVFGIDERASTPAFWRLYGEVLGDLPIAALENGAMAYLGQKDAEWFPKPGPLRALCRCREFTVAARARSLLRSLEAP
jgi:hypothetical protein